MTVGTDWIKPGVEVVVYRSRIGSADDTPERTTVERVAAKSFSLVGFSERIQLDTLTSKKVGGSWSWWQYIVVAPDDPKVAELDRAAARDRNESTAISAVRAWDKGASRRDLVALQAAIDALTAFRDAL